MRLSSKSGEKLLDITLGLTVVFAVAIGVFLALVRRAYADFGLDFGGTYSWLLYCLGVGLLVLSLLTRFMKPELRLFETPAFILLLFAALGFWLCYFLCFLILLLAMNSTIISSLQMMVGAQAKAVEKNALQNANDSGK